MKVNISYILITVLFILYIGLIIWIFTNKPNTNPTINISQIDSIEYNIKQIDSIEYNIIQRDSVIYKIKEVYEQKIKDADNLNDDDAIKLFLELVAE